MNMGLQGFYTFSLKKVKSDHHGHFITNDLGEQIVIGPAKTFEFPNLITNTGLNDLAKNHQDVLYRCLLSADNTEPQKSNDTMSIVGYADAIKKEMIKQFSNAPYYIGIKTTYRFNAGVATGNLNKVGISHKNDGTSVFSMALIKDSQGQPTTITKLADEMLEISYELRFYINTTDYVGKINISGQEHHVIVRPARLESWGSADFYKIDLGKVTAFNGEIGDIRGEPKGERQFFGETGDFKNPAYVENSYTRSYIASTTVDRANFESGIKSIVLQPHFHPVYFFQVEFNPPIMKNHRQILTLPPFHIYFGRYQDDT